MERQPGNIRCPVLCGANEHSNATSQFGSQFACATGGGIAVYRVVLHSKVLFSSDFQDSLAMYRCASFKEK